MFNNKLVVYQGNQVRVWLTFTTPNSYIPRNPVVLYSSSSGETVATQ